MELFEEDTSPAKTMRSTSVDHHAESSELMEIRRLALLRRRATLACAVQEYEKLNEHQTVEVLQNELKAINFKLQEKENDVQLAAEIGRQLLVNQELMQAREKSYELTTEELRDEMLKQRQRADMFGHELDSAMEQQHVMERKLATLTNRLQLAEAACEQAEKELSETSTKMERLKELAKGSNSVREENKQLRTENAKLYEHISQLEAECSNIKQKYTVEKRKSSDFSKSLRDLNGSNGDECIKEECRTLQQQLDVERSTRQRLEEQLAKKIRACTELEEAYAGLNRVNEELTAEHDALRFQFQQHAMDTVYSKPYTVQFLEAPSPVNKSALRMSNGFTSRGTPSRLPESGVSLISELTSELGLGRRSTPLRRSSIHRRTTSDENSLILSPIPAVANLSTDVAPAVTRITNQFQLNQTIVVNNISSPPSHRVLQPIENKTQDSSNSTVDSDTPWLNKGGYLTESIFDELHRTVKQELKHRRSSLVCTGNMISSNMISGQNTPLAKQPPGQDRSMAVTPAGEEEEEELPDVLTEYFFLTCVSVKLRSRKFDDMCKYSNQMLYDKCTALGIPFFEWHDWILQQLETASAAPDSSPLRPVLSVDRK